MKKILAVLGLAAAVPALWVGGNLIYGTITDFSPPPAQDVALFDQKEDLADSIITLMIWNIGYAGLGKESDFFYDGGSSMRTTEATTRKNMEGITEFLARNDSIDFILLQEVDTLAHRSYNINEFSELRKLMGPTHSACFTLNYNVGFVPVPYLEPMRGVKAGLASFSRFNSVQNSRHQYPSSFSWPTSIYFLDRCLLLQRIPMADGRQLVVINTHNSAYDNTGELKAAELKHLSEILAAEQAKGNAVIVGGDWNQTPPAIDPEMFNGGGGTIDPKNNLPAELLPKWRWAFGTVTPTNRNLSTPLQLGRTETHLIDLFLLSPGIELLELTTVNMDFEFSDHQPVIIKVKL